MGIDKLTHRALPWYPAAALQRLGKGITTPGVLRLVAKHHGNAETDNINWMEYSLVKCISLVINQNSELMLTFYLAS